jgi:hypothetical protein
MIPENLNRDIMTWLFNPPFANETLFTVRLALIIAAVVLFILTIIFLFKASWIRYFLWYDIVEFLTYRPFGVKKIEKDWLKNKARADTGLESEYKLSILEADSMLNDILKKMGYSGETLGEKLNNLTRATLSNIEQIKTAHQTRNNIIHDPDYKLTPEETKKVLEVFEQAFRDLEAF